jgi:uncharacterized repeat protein (TIGR03943 family)
MPRLRALIAASLPLLFTLLVLRLWVTGTLRYYVNDRTVWIVLLGACLLGAVGATAVRSALRDDHAPVLTWRTAAFLLPILVGLIVPPQPLSAASGQSSSLGSLQLASHVSSQGGDTFSAWIADLASHPNSSWWAGQHATLVGFVAHETGLPAGTVIIGRYLVTCCVVDASLLGFPVRLPAHINPPDGAWIQVSGVFGRGFWTDPSGQQYPIIERSRLSPVSIPSDPYLSP